jgi:hypothetical protein
MQDATTSSRTFIILAAAKDAGLERVGHLLADACPWLDGTEEVSPSLLAEAIAGEACGLHLSLEQAERFLHCYNARVARLLHPFATAQSEAYSAMADALGAFGRNDACGNGDFWIVDDSLSSRRPCIQVFGGFRFPDKALETLRSLLAAHAQAFDAIDITTADGDEVAVVQLDATRPD